MTELLDFVVKEGADELHIRVGKAPVLRIKHILHPVEGLPVNTTEAITMARCIVPDNCLQRLITEGSADFEFSFGATHFLVSAFEDQGSVGMILCKD